MWNAFVLASLSILVSACTDQTAPKLLSEQNVESPQTAETVVPKPTPTREPTAESVIQIPPCAELVSEETVFETFNPYYSRIENDQKQQEFFTSVMGPAATEALSHAQEVRTCSWGIPNSDGMNTTRIAVLPEDAKNRFVAALRESDFVEQTIENGTSFTWQHDRMVGSSIIWYGFHDNILVASLSESHAGGLGEPMLNAVARTSKE